jgi:D-alanine-D-alanine ligase
MSKIQVAVLMGGTSAERDVSLSTGRQILGALDDRKYTVRGLDTAQPSEMLTALMQSRPDVVVIALHGPGGEDGTVQGMLELLGIPYTGSGVLASALAMDKALAKRVLISAGVRMPQDVTLRRGDTAPNFQGFPAIVKPSRQGSTIGMSIVRRQEELSPALETAFRHDDTVLVEEFITGTEITVPVLGNAALEVLPIVEIVPSGGFYDYHAKYTAGATDEIVPARIPDFVAENARQIALLCHRTLGCRGMSRTDMIVTADREIYTLEVNTIPGMTPTSLLPRSAEAAGIPFPRLLDRLIGLAMEGVWAGS